MGMIRNHRPARAYPRIFATPSRAITRSSVNWALEEWQRSILPAMNAWVVFEPIISQLDPFYEATVFAALGDDARAMQSLERASGAQSDWLYSIGRQPWFGQYHSQPRFINIVEQLRLPLRRK